MKKRNLRHIFNFFLLLLLLIQLGACGSSDNSGGSIYIDGESLQINEAYVASVPTLGIRERAVIDQGQNEYVGVDNWLANDPIPVGTKLVNGGTSSYYSSDFSDRASVAYSNYLTTEAARIAATSGGLLNGMFYNGLVQVGPWRWSSSSGDSPAGDFTYRRYAITYGVMRPLPVTYAVCYNNPQMDTIGAPGGAHQYFAPFNRRDLIRLGYLKIVDALDSTVISRTTTISRYVTLSGRASTTTEINQLALDDYNTQIAARTTAEQQQAAALRAESISLRTNRSRASEAFTAHAYLGDITLGINARIDGYASVALSAVGNIILNGTIWGMDYLTATAPLACSVTAGSLVEAWTDRLTPGGQAVTMQCGTVQVDGRLQSQAAPWTYVGIPGKIVLTSSNTNSATTGIAITEQGQVLALLQTTQADSSLNSVQMISHGSAIEIDGWGYGFNVAADKGTVDIENTGATGNINILSRAALAADVVKAGALGSQGTLVIYAGANLDANTLVILFGGISGGAIRFRGTGDVTITSGTGISPIVISADTVEVDTGTRIVAKSWNGTTRVDATADIYCNQCYWNPVSGGDVAAGRDGTWTSTPNRLGPPPANRSF